MAEGFGSDQSLLKLRWDLRDRLMRELRPDLDKQRQRFIPRDALFRIIERRNVLKILKASSSQTDDNATNEEIAQRLCPKENVFLGPALHPVCDSTWYAQRNLAQGSSTVLGLTEAEARLFDFWQWIVFTPFIERLSADVPKFHDEVSLPWCELTSTHDIAESTDDDIEGQVTVVQKARIYTNNHNLTEKDDDYVVVKLFNDLSISEARKEMFEREVQANRNTPQHDRIVPLLAAFEHCQIPYLLFPWAQEGNLQELWKKYELGGVQPSSRPPEYDWYSDNWLFDECFQVAEALATFQGFRDGGRSGSAPQIHMDIKPENILCFESVADGKKHFILKLSDLGEARQAGTGESIDSGFIPHVKTQRPPESEAISFKYDVWCLGCVFLEFVTWALCGWHGCIDFREERFKEQDAPETTDLSTGSRFEDDIFFKKVKGKRKLVPVVDYQTIKTFTAGRSSTRRSFQIVSRVEIIIQIKDSVITRLMKLTS
ncbi:kinase-like protein [Cryphonectria parasitica EP155]|uniref:Kinase-like protein n=1 Tax=Cryphonectria parasitica (strain ATCC 38755 / EP155) TaxID=660469 RepID=A0A9P4Y4S5_CRYP1|nr:kinase-like protein [Cryphonectria parasitica EP155]KAF3766480.1 kinase-like protein [Cryphonectria parasitica EP155]